MGTAGVLILFSVGFTQDSTMLDDNKVMNHLDAGFWTVVRARRPRD